MERYCVNLVLSWNTFVSPSMVIESFAGSSSLGWHLCSLSKTKGTHAFVEDARGKITCKFDFVVEYFGFSIYGN